MKKLLMGIFLLLLTSTAFAGGGSIPGAVTVGSDGSVYVAASAANQSGNMEIIVLCYSADGELKGVKRLDKTVGGLAVPKAIFADDIYTVVAGTEYQGGGKGFDFVAAKLDVQFLPEPQLLAPPDKTQNMDFQPLLEWRAVQGAMFYDLMVAKDADFDDIVISETDLPDRMYQVDSDLESNTEYHWKVRARNENGNSSWSDVWSFTTKLGNSVEDFFADAGIILEQTYPNPLSGNQMASLKYFLPSDGFIRLTVIDAQGREIKLIDEGYKSRGEHETAFELGGVPSGAYYYLLSAGGKKAVKSLILAK